MPVKRARTGPSLPGGRGCWRAISPESGGGRLPRWPVASDALDDLKGGPAVSTTAIPDRFTALPDEPALQATVVAPEEHGFSVEVAGDLDAARQAVLARSPDGSLVMTSTSVTLDQTGLADAANDGSGRQEPARNTMFALDFATQAQPVKAIGGQPGYALGRVHAITGDGTALIAPAAGRQLASCARGAAQVIFVA